MLVSDFTSGLDRQLSLHLAKASQYGTVRGTYVSVGVDLFYLMSLVGDGEGTPSEFHTALRLRDGQMEVYYECPM